MSADTLPVVWVVVATLCALMAWSTFGVFRHRSRRLALSSTGPDGGGSADDGSADDGSLDDGSADDGSADDGPTDLRIANRIASVLGDQEEPRDADIERRAGTSTDPGSARRPSGLVPDDPARCGAISAPAPATAGAGAGLSLNDVVPSAPASPGGRIAQRDPWGEGGESELGDGSAERWVDDGSMLHLQPGGHPADAAAELPPIAAVAPSDWPEARVDAAGLFGPGDPAVLLSELLVDLVTGLGSGLAWDRWLADEEARERRYRRPTTVVLVEMAEIDAIPALSGQEVAARVVIEVANTIRANVRASDHVALVRPARFAVLLPETDDVRAINFVERVRAACEAWLSTNAPGVRIGFGWASPDASTDLRVACVAADKRLAADLRAAPSWPARD
jgi:diguanylate cyclase (GGDEF)-like protein